MKEATANVIVLLLIVVVITTVFIPAMAVKDKEQVITEEIVTAQETSKEETTTVVPITSVVTTTTETEATTKTTVTETTTETTKATETTAWKGKKLTKRLGTVKGPEGKETFYNLPMGGVIKIAKRELGMYEEYWVREDGVKMYGKYVMCAADFRYRPRGTVVQTSLGEGMILDTGCSYGTIDIAVNWVV